ncbi:hypothetical protein Q7390_03425 [Glaesserella parasuis]|nr:hypothetical protein [Glaesserella parasuis]
MSFKILFRLVLVHQDIFFNNLSEPIFSELQYLEVNELKKIILGRMVELALIKGTSMSSINKALTHNIVRRICEDGAEEIAKKITNVYH